MEKLLYQEGSRVMRCSDGETLWVEPWGENSIRVRAIRMGQPLPQESWALSEPHADAAEISLDTEAAVIKNGKICAELTVDGRLIFRRQDGRVLLEEYSRNKSDPRNHSPLEIISREFYPILGGDYRLTARFESNPTEKLYGMGQYQQPYLNLKGCRLELAQRNTQASVPFLVSSLGYGFLWNNPAVGSVTFGKNITEWNADSTKYLDYWITAGDSPKEIEASYTAVSGRVPMMPESVLGFWQCKLRYQTQEELLDVAREYKKRGIPLDVIVADFFHWPALGDWKFDPEYWPDPEAMVRELKEMGIELMVSVWPNVEKKSENYNAMRRAGYFIQADRGVQVTMEFIAPSIFFDATNPGARDFLWSKLKQNYYDKGIKLFWLDESEPELKGYCFDNYRYYIGSSLQMGNVYPLLYAKTVYDGMKGEDQKDVLTLVRCAWAGSQKYGALVWSGDVASSFESMRSQLTAGLNMGLAGIPWWTTDIGGFHGGDPGCEEFRELLIRWFQWGAFCPIMRLHGDRSPKKPPLRTSTGAYCQSGADNEVWSFGPKAYEICKKYIFLREKMKPYLKRVMREAHETGAPVMRTLFFEFPEDQTCWEIEDEYLLGGELLVAPVMDAGARKRTLYLPAGADWKEYETGVSYPGGQWITVDAPLESIPVFLKNSFAF